MAALGAGCGGKIGWRASAMTRGRCGELGAKYVGMVQSLIVTCRLHQIDPYDYLVDVLQRVDQHPASAVHLLTPRLWKCDSIPGSGRRTAGSLRPPVKPAVICALSACRASSLSSTVSRLPGEPCENAARIRSISVANALGHEASDYQGESKPFSPEPVPGRDSRGRLGYVAPVGPPRGIVQKPNEEINRPMLQPDVAAKMAAAGLVIITEPPEYFGQIIRGDYPKHGKRARGIGFQPQ